MIMVEGVNEIIPHPPGDPLHLRRGKQMESRSRPEEVYLAIALGDVSLLTHRGWVSGNNPSES